MSPGTLVLIAAVQAGLSLTELPSPAELSSVEVRAVEAGRDGSMWFSVRDVGLARLYGGRVELFTSAHGLMSNGIADILEDRHGTLWAVGRSGYSILDSLGWSASSEVGGLQTSLVFGVYEDLPTESVWLAANGGVARLTAGAWSVVRPRDGLPHVVAHDVVVDHEGTIWVACRTGVARIRDGEISVYFPELNVRSALIGPDGGLWFGTSDGVLSWNGTSWSRHLRGITVYPKLVTRDGVVWAGSAHAGVFRYEGGSWHGVQLPLRLARAEIFDIAEDGEGTIWLATSLGAVRLDRGR